MPWDEMAAIPALVIRASLLTKAYSIPFSSAGSDRLRTPGESDRGKGCGVHLSRSSHCHCRAMWAILCEAALTPCFSASPHQALRE